MKIDTKIDEVEFSAFDTETTGLNPQTGDRIIEIAAIRFRGENVLSTFQSLINPHRPVSEGAFQVNRISSAMLKEAPENSKVIPEFLSFIKDSCLLSYNASFDMEFLDNELKLLGLKVAPDIEIVDILKMARRLLPGINRYALVSVSEALGLGTTQKHRAFFDAQLAFKVFNI
jgi:DNA polymerase III epsilon subunit family exonuclease